MLVPRVAIISALVVFLLVACTGANPPGSVVMNLASVHPILVAKGLKSKVTIIGILRDGSSKDVTGDLSFRVKNETLATIDSTGLIVPLAEGTTELEGALKADASIRITVPITISAATLSQLIVSGPTLEGPKGLTRALEIRGVLSDFSVVNNLADLSFDFSKKGTAEMASSSLPYSLKFLSAGVTELKISSGTVSTTVAIKTNNAVFDHYTFSSAELSLPQGVSSEVYVQDVYTDRSTVPHVGPVTWLGDTSTRVFNFNIVERAGQSFANVYADATLMGTGILTAVIGDAVIRATVTVLPAIPSQIVLGQPSMLFAFDRAYGMRRQSTATKLRYSNGLLVETLVSVDPNEYLTAEVTRGWLTLVTKTDRMDLAAQPIQTKLVVRVGGLSIEIAATLTPKFVSSIVLRATPKIPASYQGVFSIAEMFDNIEDYGMSGNAVCFLSHTQGVLENDANASVVYTASQGQKGYFIASTAGDYYLNCADTILDYRNGSLGPTLLKASGAITIVPNRVDSFDVVKVAGYDQNRFSAQVTMQGGEKFFVPACFVRFENRGEYPANRPNCEFPEDTLADWLYREPFVGSYYGAVNVSQAANPVYYAPPLPSDSVISMRLKARIGTRVSEILKFEIKAHWGPLPPWRRDATIFNMGTFTFSDPSAFEVVGWGEFRALRSGSFEINYEVQGKRTGGLFTISDTRPAFVVGNAANQTASCASIALANSLPDASKYQKLRVLNDLRAPEGSSIPAVYSAEIDTLVGLGGEILFYPRGSISYDQRSKNESFYFDPTKATLADGTPYSQKSGMIISFFYQPPSSAYGLSFWESPYGYEFFYVFSSSLTRVDPMGLIYLCYRGD